MECKVVKRNGKTVVYDGERIVQAIEKAMKESKRGVVHEDAINIENFICKKVQEDGIDTIKVEDIQDLIEQKLMTLDYETAKKFILYRDTKRRKREMNTFIMKKAYEKVRAKAIENSNANVDENSFSGRVEESGSVLQRELALANTISYDVAQAHDECLVYQHDLNRYEVGMHNCLQLDMQNVLENGFNTRNGDVRPPTSFSTACQLVAVSFQAQSQCQFGGVGSIHIDRDLAPTVLMSYKKHAKDGIKYIAGYDNEEEIKKIVEGIQSVTNIPLGREDVYRYATDMLEKEGKQAAEGLFHNLNTLESRPGSQVPFTSLNYGRDTSPEGRLVTKWLFNASINGIGKHHRTSIFPISIFQYKKGTNANPGDPNYDMKKLAIDSLSKRLYPNFCNGDWSQANEDPNNPDTYFSTMGCRTMIGYDRHGYGYVRVGRGNIAPATIILPKIGIENGICLGKRNEPDIEGFWKMFEATLRLTEKSLVERFAHVASQRPEAATFMYENGTMLDTNKCKENVYNAVKHGTLAIGYIGIAEMCQAMFGKDHTEDKDVHAFALSVVKRINEFAKEASERNDLNFSCYATPAEGLCSTALEKLKEQYGVIPRVTDRDYLTNSHHCPVWHKLTIIEKLQIEAPFCKYPTGGCITYIEFDSSFVKNKEAIEKIIDYAFNELDIPYLAINFPNDICLDCGYQGEFTDQCKECGSENIHQLRRVTGYLTTDWHKFNKGKRAEVQDRIKHSEQTKYREYFKNGL